MSSPSPTKTQSLVLVITAFFEHEEAMKTYFKTIFFQDLGASVDTDFMELHAIATEDEQSSFFDYLMDEEQGYVKKIPFLIPELQEDLEDEAISHVILIYADKAKNANLDLFKLNDDKVKIDVLKTFYCIEF
jgi:hypothetical protein